MAIKPIALSFKNNHEDIELYTWVTSHSNMSGFIKDILRDAMNGKEGRIAITENKNNENELIDLDF